MSIYPAEPEGMTLEVSALTGEDMTQWIDPEVAVLVRLSENELDKLMNPPPFQRPNQVVPQPPIETASDYRLAYSEAEYEAIVGLPDDVISESTRDILLPN